MLDTVIRGGTVVDGTGAPSYKADVRVCDGLIAEIGPNLEAGPRERVVDAAGCYVAPGFIETHNHFDAPMWWMPTLEPMPGYGVTTSINGNCGFSAAPVSDDPEVRLEALFDPGSVRLLTPHDSSGEVAALGTIDGMTAVAFASDPRVQGGAMGSEGCAAIVAAYEEALAQGAPVIGLWHSGGARLREGVESLHAVGTVFAAMTRASGKIPQISVVLGPAAGGAAYGPATGRHRRRRSALTRGRPRRRLPAAARAAGPRRPGGQCGGPARGPGPTGRAGRPARRVRAR